MITGHRLNDARQHTPVQAVSGYRTHTGLRSELDMSRNYLISTEASSHCQIEGEDLRIYT
jgi:hypothetical protein